MAGTQVAFKKDDYDRLIKYYNDAHDGVKNELERDHDSVTPRLEEGVIFKPGSGSWDLAASASSRVKSLATAFSNQYTGLGKRYTDFAKQLKGARDVFDDTDDLAQMSAQDFVTNYLGKANVIGRKPK